MSRSNKDKAKFRQHYKSLGMAPIKMISQAQMEYNYTVAGRMLRHYGLDAELLSGFTKKQLQYLLGTMYELPIIKAEKDGTIPRRIVEQIRAEILKYMKTTFWGDPEDLLTYTDLITCGMPFFMSLVLAVEGTSFAGAATNAPLQTIYARIKEEEIFQVEFSDILAFVRYITRSYSQVNFRLYGFLYSWDTVFPKMRGAHATLRMKIELTVQDCEWKMFTYNGIERKAFRLLLTANGIYEPSWAIVWKKKIFPRADEKEKLNIYIQSHVLHRFKERMDGFSPSVRNFMIQYALTNGQEIVQSDKQLMLACLIEYGLPAGYFTFFVQGDDLVVNTFIPLTSPNTPEGRKLHKILPLGKEDMKYLGMDRLSFYGEVDFEQIPILKQALIESGIWETREVLVMMATRDAESKDPADLISAKWTALVKNFFDKYEQHRSAMLPVDESYDDL